MPETAIRPRTFPNRPFLIVPWAKAETLRMRLQEARTLVTACFDLAERIAGLEFAAGTDLPKAVQALNELDPSLNLSLPEASATPEPSVSAAPTAATLPQEGAAPVMATAAPAQ